MNCHARGDKSGKLSDNNNHPTFCGRVVVVYDVRFDKPEAVVLMNLFIYKFQNGFIFFNRTPHTFIYKLFLNGDE